MRLYELFENFPEVAESKIKLSTDLNWYGAEIGDYKATGPVVNIPADNLVGFEPDNKMNQPASKANVEKIIAGLKQGAKLPPLVVRQYKNGYQVLDDHHRFWAYKLLGIKSIPAQVVPDEDIIENFADGIRAYHGGPAGITRFRPLTHFGSEQAARSRMAKKKIDGQVYEVELSIRNPAVIRDFAGVHAPTQFAFALNNAGIIDHDEMKTVTGLMGQPDRQTPILVKLLQSKGYDGIAYRNRYEDPGHTSYVILHPDQARIVVDENFADGKKPGRKGLAKRMGVNCKASVTQLRKVAKNSSGERQRMAHWCANMKSGRKSANEAEDPLWSTRAQEIYKTLKKNGYKQLGKGADSTVWTKDAGSVIKILMPDNVGTAATETFKKFYKFCRRHQSNPFLPKFVSIQGQDYAEFEIQGRPYIQISMEELTPLKNGSLLEGMVWLMSDAVRYKTPWPKLKQQLLTASEWAYIGGVYGNGEKYVAAVKRWDSQQEQQAELLYTTIMALYHTGRINKYGWDLHTANVMLRSDGTPVIIDPWFADGLDN